MQTLQSTRLMISVTGKIQTVNITRSYLTYSDLYTDSRRLSTGYYPRLCLNVLLYITHI